jgi:cysteine-rich repeat protein
VDREPARARLREAERDGLKAECAMRGRFWTGAADGAGEECDDGNALNGDGCSAHCRIEEGWTCTTTSFSPISLTPSPTFPAPSAALPPLALEPSPVRSSCSLRVGAPFLLPSPDEYSITPQQGRFNVTLGIFPPDARIKVTLNGSDPRVFGRLLQGPLLSLPRSAPTLWVRGLGSGFRIQGSECWVQGHGSYRSRPI